MARVGDRERRARGAIAPDRRESYADATARIAQARTLRQELEHDRVSKKLPDLAALAATTSYYRRALDRLVALESRIAAVRIVHAHLACDGLLGARPVEGGYTWQKESPVGPRIWRYMFVGPSWLPPMSTPDRELVRASDGRYVLAREQLAPSYRAAFGLVAFVHLREERMRDRVVLDDEGIRTHGTGQLASLANGVSHGCHRLLGRNVVRLAGFVLAHRDHVRLGDEATYYRRIVRYRGTFPIAIDTLGYRIELVPPIPVTVLPGRVHR